MGIRCPDVSSAILVSFSSCVFLRRTRTDPPRTPGGDVDTDHLHRAVERIPYQRFLLHELGVDNHSGHHKRSTRFIEIGSMYCADGPEEMRPVGEVEFVQELVDQVSYFLMVIQGLLGCRARRDVP
jgi:hypothetical protein